MVRSATLLVLAAGLFSTAAYRPAFLSSIPCPTAVNSTVAPLRWTDPVPVPENTDPNAALHILMLDYPAYDSVYARKVRRFVQQHLPASAIAEFWDGSATDLSAALADVDAVVVAYPANGQPAMLRAYGKALTQFVRNGGAVILTGTNEYSVLQFLGLIELDYGYFCEDLPIHAVLPQHPVFTGLPENISLSNFAYPLDVSDPGFVTLAEIRGYPVLGFKAIGAGKVVYLGIEYYYNESDATRLLANAICWAVPTRADSTATTEPLAEAGAANPAVAETWSAVRPVVKRTEEVLFTGGRRAATEIDLKIYPNPYYSKANLDLVLAKAARVAVEMTDEAGRQTAVILPQRALGAGSYRLELPNVPPGVYFVQCNINGQVTVKKVVKTEAQ